MLAGVYLIFNEGYGGRGELAVEALRLGRALAELMPDEPEVHGLLAMMLPHEGRREARFRDGDLVLLADQDRSLWDTAQIADGRAVLDRALALRGWGPYVVQAAIASLHADKAREWPQIAALYGELVRLTDSVVVELSRAVAVAEADGPEAGLAIVDRLALEHYRYLHSTRAELLRRLGRTQEASDPTAGRWRSLPTTPSAVCWSGGWRRWLRLPVPHGSDDRRHDHVAPTESEPEAAAGLAKTIEHAFLTDLQGLRTHQREVLVRVRGSCRIDRERGRETTDPSRLDT